MDPNANIEEQRRLAKRVLEMSPKESETLEYYEKTQRLAELVEALDGWISNGGFLPTGWNFGG